MPRKQKYKIRVILKGTIIREITAPHWNAKERFVEELREKYPRAEIDVQAV